MSEAPCCQKGLRALISRKLGRCPTCMRASAFGTLAGWATFAAISVVWPHPTLLALGLLVAASFTLLLLAHLIAFMARVAPLHPVLHADHSGGIPAEFSVGRRAMLLRLGHAALWAAAVFGLGLMGMPRKAEVARAQQGCKRTITLKPNTNTPPREFSTTVCGSNPQKTAEDKLAEDIRKFMNDTCMEQNKACGTEKENKKCLQAGEFTKSTKCTAAQRDCFDCTVTIFEFSCACFHVKKEEKKKK